MARPKSRRLRRLVAPPLSDFSEEKWTQKVLSPPILASWVRLVDEVNNPDAVNPAARFGSQDDEVSRFKVAVYEQVRVLLRNGKLGHIKRFCDIAGKYPIGPLRDNPFHWALFSLSKSGRVVQNLHDAQVRQLGLQLNYAHRHAIPPELLIGFLHQTGATGKKKQAWIAANPHAHEWWFETYRGRFKISDEESERN